MKYIKLYENRHDFVFDEQRYFPNTALVNGEEEPTYFTDVEEVVFELTVSLPTEKVVTGETYTIAVEYGGADVFEDSTVTTTGDVTLNGTQFTANTDGDFSVTATYGDKTVTLNGTSKLMTAAPRISFDDMGCGIYKISIGGNALKRITFNGEEFTPSQQQIFNYKNFYADLTEQTVFVTATAEEEGKWESDVATATYTIPVLQTLTATISDDTLEDGQTAQMTVMYGNQNVTEHIGIKYTASGDVTCTNGNALHIGAGVVTAAYSTGSGSIVVSSNGELGNPNLTPITINVTVTEAVPKNIVFADPDVKAILVNKFGSDGEITEAQAAAVTTWFSGMNSSTNPFHNNGNVDSFDEFSYFTGVTEIGSNAFQQCSNMKSITLPSSLTSIPDYTFSGCSSLGSVTIPENVTSIGKQAFATCSAIESVNIPASVTSIGDQAFANCSALDSVNIPASVTSIGNYAFNHCRKLTSVTIPASVTSIGNGAFNDCRVLTSITCNATTPPTFVAETAGDPWTVFNNTNDCPINVPSASLDAYKTAWSNYADRIQAIVEPTPDPNPEYATAVLDCSELEDANPLEFCANYDTEGEFPEGVNTLDCTFDGEVSYVENGVITIPTNGNFSGFNVDADYEMGGIVYVKLTHPSAEYKFNADTTVLNTDFFTCDVTFDSTTLTTTIDNIVQLDNIVFDGSNFELFNGGSTDIKITQIEVGYVPASEEEE